MGLEQQKNQKNETKKMLEVSLEFLSFFFSFLFELDIYVKPGRLYGQPCTHT